MTRSSCSTGISEPTASASHLRIEEREARGGRAELDLRSRVPRPPSHNDKGDYENHDPNHAEDVGRHGNRTGDIARVRPDESDYRSHNEDGDHRSKPVQNPSSRDGPQPTPLAKRASSIGARELQVGGLN